MKLEWSNFAVSDLELIKEYVSRDSEFYAARLVERVIQSVEILSSFPHIGRYVPEAEGIPNIREVISNPYRIIYRTEEYRVLILAVIHSARNLAEIEPKPWELS
jgi:plasmid stabilization system protein ParE